MIFIIMIKKRKYLKLIEKKNTSKEIKNKENSSKEEIINNENLSILTQIHESIKKENNKNGSFKKNEKEASLEENKYYINF